MQDVLLDICRLLSIEEAEAAPPLAEGTNGLTPGDCRHTHLLQRTESMTDQTTPGPLVQTSAPIVRTFPDLVTKIGEKDIYAQTEDLAALIGGIISGVLLTFICTIAVLLWCLSRQKGSYATNETDEDEDEDDNRSAGSDAELQSKKPLKDEEED
ncbi:hypothetical protein OJAV_G00013270 [Oryzias javanicus]|uniref:Neurexin/syndecan/glycophorin C domain-containing protein n=1 Tax=Oryzias javanicus TaxID=123683 RepID=A0A3S2Q0G4_ORYJA|nr:hypothetical protein OJAV_G00013270 [Oryzias javanicus]